MIAADQHWMVVMVCRCGSSFLGSVPAYYREVYEAIRCRTHERVQVEVFQRLLLKSDLSKATLGQVRKRQHFKVRRKL